MTSENIDTDFIKIIGSVILANGLIFIANTLLYGIFLLLFCISTVIFIRRGFTTRTQQMMLIISVICFALFSLSWVLNAIEEILFVKMVLVDNITLSEAVNTELYNTKVKSFRTTTEAIRELLAPISDTVVVWRAWVILPSQRRWMIGPVILLVCTLGVTVSHILISSLYGHVPTLMNGRVNDGLFTSEIATSMMSNLIATLLISYNLWDHRKHVSGNLGHRRSPSQGEKILAVLVESGAAYCVIQATILVLLVITSHTTLGHSLKIYVVYQVFFQLYSGASAMHSIIVFMLVRLQLSFEHTYGFSLVSQPQEHGHRNTSRLPTIGQLQFAPAPANHSNTSEENGEI